MGLLPAPEFCARRAGQQLADGAINPQEMLTILGREAVQQYLADEVQRFSEQVMPILKKRGLGRLTPPYPVAGAQQPMRAAG